MENKNKFKINSILILIITLAIMWYILKDNLNLSIKLILNSNKFWIIFAIIIFIIFSILESVVLKNIINDYKKEYSLKDAMKLNMMTKFFNGITPFSSGGQPFLLYQLKKEGIKLTDGTIIIVEHFVVFQSSLVLMAFISIVVNTILNIVKSNSLLNKFVVLGFVINFALLIFVYIISINKNINQKIINFLIKLLNKLKFIKNKEKLENKWTKACNEYYEGWLQIRKNKKKVVNQIIIETIALIIWFTMPIFIFKSLGYTASLNVFICLLISIYIFFVGSYMPAPGGSGGIEYAFVGFFSFYIGNTYLAPALIIWRLLNYYIPMIIGGILFNLHKNKELE